MEFIDVAQSPTRRRSRKRRRPTVSMAPRHRHHQKSFKSPLFNAVEQTAEERISNFFWLFFKLEKLVFFGFWICCDSFLMLITILPTRVLCRMYYKLSSIARREWHLFSDCARYHALHFVFRFEAAAAPLIDDKL